MTLVVHPLRGVNEIEFGMTADMVGARMPGSPDIGAIRATSADYPTYYYDDVPAFFYFDENGFLDTIEFCRGAEVEVGGINPFNLTVRQALDFMKRLDPEVEIDDDGAVSHKLSLSIWCPFIGNAEDEEPVETLLIAKPGYFSRAGAS